MPTFRIYIYIYSVILISYYYTFCIVYNDLLADIFNFKLYLTHFLIKLLRTHYTIFYICISICKIILT